MRVATQSFAVSLTAFLLLAAVPRAAWGTETVRLGSLDMGKMTAGWGTPQVDLSISKTPLSLAGKRFAHGVGTHAPSVVWIDLAGGSDRFLATLGVDDSAHDLGDGVVFKIIGDGKMLFQSGTLKRDQTPKTVDIDVRGVKSLGLVVNYVGNGACPHGDWADARFLVSGAKPRTIDFPYEKGYVLTPPSPPTPRINGAKIFGVRPGSPFFFTIPATGQRPMTFAVENLPAGLSVNPQTGYISGKLDKRGRYAVVFHGAERPGRGTASLHHRLRRHFELDSRNGLEQLVLLAEPRGRQGDARRRRRHGHQRHDQPRVHLCEHRRLLAIAPRDAAGKIMSNSRFPDMKAMTDYIHHRGLRAGIYTSPGPSTCAGYTGAYQHEEQDAQRFAEWGFDFLKYDWCTCAATGPGLAGIQEPYRKMSAFLKKQPRDIVLNLCQYGNGDVWKWGKEVGGNSWRTADDLGRGFYAEQFDMIGTEVFDRYAKNELHKYAGPGGWNDPDYLLLGYLWAGRTRLSPHAQYAHVSLWALLAAPLIFAGDITRLDDCTLSLLSNDEVIEVDQDPLGKPGRRVAKDGDQEVWARPLEDGSLAVGLFNRGEMAARHGQVVRPGAPGQAARCATSGGRRTWARWRASIPRRCRVKACCCSASGQPRSRREPRGLSPRLSGVAGKRRRRAPLAHPPG